MITKRNEHEFRSNKVIVNIVAKIICNESQQCCSSFRDLTISELKLC